MEEKVIEKETVVEKKELNLDQKVNVKNLAGWDVGFKRISELGDCTIPANGSTRLTRNEIIMQIQSGNKLFIGTDTRGSHATVYIEDAPTRIEVEFDSEYEKTKQVVLSEDSVKKMFELKTDNAFEKRLKEIVVTRAEKYALINYMRKLKVDCYSKVKIVEKYTGYRY